MSAAQRLACVLVIFCYFFKYLSATGCEDTPCGENSICTTLNNGEYNCRCRAGFTSVNGRNCFDANKCSKENCGANSECVQHGSEAACRCNAGFYSPSGSQRDCIDRNECTLHPCGSFSTCTNTIGSYNCRCFGGYISDLGDNTDCRAVQAQSACNFAHTCGTHSKCSRTSMRSTHHRCSCIKGYWSSNQKNCVDRDECTLIPNNGACSSNSRCQNLQGTYECICNEGFQKDSYGRCVDIDECLDRPCGSNSDCLNTFGSYECTCAQWYMSRSGDGHNCVEDPNAEGSTQNVIKENCRVATIIASVTAGLFGLVVICMILYLLHKRRKRSQRRKFAQGKGTFSSR